MSREMFLNMTHQTNLNRFKESIKDCYTPKMVEHIQNKFQKLYQLISENESKQVPKGTMLDMIEEVTRMSRYQDKFDKLKFFKNAKNAQNVRESY